MFTHTRYKIQRCSVCVFVSMAFSSHVCTRENRLLNLATLIFPLLSTIPINTSLHTILKILACYRTPSVHFTEVRDFLVKYLWNYCFREELKTLEKMNPSSNHFACCLNKIRSNKKQKRG
jgi:hypothetical protein